MGVSGCGKSTVGEELSSRLDWPFLDGDDYHPQVNINKLTRGIPLTDEDRQPWLETLHDLIVEHLSEGRSMIMASSALKASYRRILDGGREDVRFVHLQGSFDLVFERMQQRRGHFMEPEMLLSQFESLEIPTEVLTIPITLKVEEIADRVISSFNI
jgi:gluconokinase